MKIPISMNQKKEALESKPIKKNETEKILKCSKKLNKQMVKNNNPKSL